MLYSCNHLATVDVKGVTLSLSYLVFVWKYLCGSKSTSTAQRVAAVWTGGRRSSLTLAMSCADTAALGVRSTVVGRALHVHQLRVADRLPSHALLSAAEQRRGGAWGGGGGDHGSRRDLDRLLVFVSQCVADSTKLWQRFPAGPDGTRAWHAVAATLGCHQLRHDLYVHITSVIQCVLKKYPLTFYFISSWPRIYTTCNADKLKATRKLFVFALLPARRYAGLRESNVSVCLFICHTPVLCQSEESVVISWLSGIPTIRVFWRKISSRHSKGFPRAGAANKGEVGKFIHFLSLSINISKTVADRTKVKNY